MVSGLSKVSELPSACNSSGTETGWLFTLFLHFFHFLVLLFSYYILLSFLMMLSVILQSRLMIPLSTPSVIRILICCNSQNWHLNLNLTYKTLWTGFGGGFLIWIWGKLNLFLLIVEWGLLLLKWKWMCLSLMKNHLQRCWAVFLF